MRQASLGSAVVLLLALSVSGSRPLDVSATEPSLVGRQVERAIRYMDSGIRSAEYRASIAYLRDHSDEAARHIGGDLLTRTGTVRKWQLTYLLGELGNERAIELLEELIEAPLPDPQTSASVSHAIDLEHAEEVRVRFRAVASIGRNGRVRPDLRDLAVASLVDIGRRTPFMTSAAIFELRTLLGDDAYALRSSFGSEHVHEFDRFVPGPRWQWLMSERLQARTSELHSVKELSLWGLD